MSSFLILWHRAGDAIPVALIERADTHRIAGERGAPRRHLDGAAAAWHWESAWAPGAESALPLASDGWLLTGTLRLDDRAALASRLRDRGRDVPVGDDARLAMASLHAWGDDAPSRWIGDYALAALAPARDRLVVTRGVTGVRSCFVLTRGALTAVSDDLGLLVRLAGPREAPVDEAVAEFLQFGTLVSPRLTFHRDIVRVPTAHTLVISRDARERLVRHWEFPVPEVRHGRADDEVISEFRAVLGAAVADRLRGPRAAILLSGGLDSPALAVESRQAAPGVALHAITASWERLLDDPEPAFARRVASMLGIDQTVHAFAADEGLPGGAPFQTPEPVPDSEPWLWRSQAARLAAHAPVVLNGEDVDALLTPPTLVEQLARDGVGETIAAWGAYRRETGMRPWAGVRETLRDAMGPRADPPAPRWLHREASARGDGGRQARVAHPTRPAAVRKLQQSTWDAVCWLDDPVMSGADVIVLLPFMDPRVISCCFALPAVPWTQKKHLLRRAYEGVLPADVLSRPKAPVRGYYEARLRVWRAAGAAAPLPAGVDGWVDVRRWRDVLATSTDTDEVWAAWRVLELSRWLAQEWR